MRIGVNTADFAACDAVLEFPAHAPVSHGMLRLDIELDGDTITSATPILGAMHRGAEKLFESRDYRQIISLANRHEWLSSFSGEVGVALMVEQALGIEVPNHAAWLRTLLLEHHRVTSHLAFLAGYPWQSNELVTNLRSERERWVTHLEQFTGARMHAMLTVIGGTSREPGAAWLDAVAPLRETALRCADAVEQALGEIEPDIGQITKADVESYALSGPVAAASGVRIDSRLSTRGLRFNELTASEVITQESGDVRARIAQLVGEIRIAVFNVNESATQCARLVGSPHNVLLPKVVRVPEGKYTQTIETPLGQALWYLVSTGDKTPQRLGLRPASLHTVIALSAALQGARFSDAARIIASMPFVTGDAER